MAVQEVRGFEGQLLSRPKLLSLRTIFPRAEIHGSDGQFDHI